MGGRHGTAGNGSEPPARRQPGLLELLRWSAILFGISLLVAAIAIPLVRWLGFG